MNKPNTKKINFPSPDEIDNDSQLKESVDRDFGSVTDVLADGVSRRRWLQLMGASLALGGATGCRYQEETIAPFAFRPQNRIPGIPEKFASMLEFDGIAQPVLATCYDGRPIKLDGNPDHKHAGSGSNSFTQSRILELYDPDRLREPMMPREPGMSVKDATMTPATRADVAKAFESLQGGSLSDVAVLSGPSSSPTLHRLKKELEGRGANWFTFASITDDNSRAGSKLAFGKVLRAHHAFDEADVIVTIDADPLQMDAAGVANSLRFAKGRDVDHEKMSRMYTIESQYSTTGGSADHRMSMRSTDIGKFVAALAEAVAANAGIGGDLSYREKMLAVMADDLIKAKAKGRSVIVCGERQSPEVHAAVHAINESLGNNGTTIRFTEPVDADRPMMLDAIKDFAAKAGSMKTVVIIEGNPVYDAPRELKLGEVISSVENSIHLTLARNITSQCCKVVSDIAHGLESWGDGQAYDGSICISQPLIRPLFGSPSVIELLAGIAGQEYEVSEADRKRGNIPVGGMDLVKETSGLEGDFWNQAVQAGFIAGSEADPVSASCGDVAKLEGAADWNKAWDGDSIEVVFTPSSSLYDGRFANNAWLQELPDFFTKVTWDNTAVMSPKTAASLSTVGEKLVNIKVGDELLSLPVCVVPGTADGSIGIALGYGRTMAGRVGGNLEGAATVGEDAGVLRSADSWYVADGVSVDATRNSYPLATIQEMWNFDPVGTAEIQNRMFRNPAKSESDRSSMIREGSFDSYKEFLHKDHSEGGHASVAPRKNRVFNPADGSLAVLTTNVAYVSSLDDGEDGHDHEHDESEHGHGHEPHWPEAFHMHHELFDITPGSRETYKKGSDKSIHAWGMSIDLNKCTGCNACVIACQAENNIPVVGKSQVRMGREMHWMRIDRYFGNNLYNTDAAGENGEDKKDDEQVAIQPVTCHHCENAPCETVCPVAATVHSSEGLNDMVYNRCIGTRYCGNNCPYKVRRFNFFNYADAVTLIKYPGADKLPAGDRNLQNLMMNPEVTVRSRGVMEKCTYCTQRISNGRIKSKNEGREIGANEITTACQDVCPTQAIKFGDLNVEENEAAMGHANPRSYTMLEELNNHPRTKYLARVRNVHPELTDHDDRDSVRGGRPGADDAHTPAATGSTSTPAEAHNDEEAAAGH